MTGLCAAVIQKLLHVYVYIEKPIQGANDISDLLARRFEIFLTNLAAI
jgi:hypothetical protein